MGKFKLKMDNMRRAYEMQDRDGDYFKIPDGDSMVYIHPPCRTEDDIKAEIAHYNKKKMKKERRQVYLDVLNLFDGVNYLEVMVHFGIGKNNRMVVCLDEDNNPIVNHPIFQKFAKKKGIKLTGQCPTCESIQSGDLDDEQMDEMKTSKRYLFGVTPIKTREKSSKPWNKVPPSPSVLWAGKTIYDGIMDLFFESEDITDPEEAIYAKINRKGKGKFDTRYKISADTQSLKKPKKLSKKFVEMVERAMNGGSSDLFKILADSTLSYQEIVAQMSGVKVEKSEDEEEEEEREDVDVEEEENEEETESDDEEEEDEDDDEEGDDDEDDEKGDDEDDEDDEDEEGDDDEDDEEDDDEDDEDDEDEEDEEPEPEPKTKKKAGRPKKTKVGTTAKKTKVKKKKQEEEEEEDDDDDLDDLDAELERIKKKKVKKKTETKTTAKAKGKTKAKGKKKGK